MELTCVRVALPNSVKYLEHVREAVNAYLTPVTLNNAVRYGCLSVLQRFGSKPCTVGAMNSALDNGHYSALKWLITAQKLASKSIVPNNALKKAAQEGRRDAVELLVDDCSDEAVEKALQYATRKEQWGVVKALLTKCKARGAALGEALKTAAKKGREDVVGLLWERCGEKDVARALADAAYEGRWGVVQVLYLHCDGDSKQLGSALTCAIDRENWEMVERIYPRAGEKNVVEALKLVTIKRHWRVAKLLCGQLQESRCGEALTLAERDDGRALLDVLYKRCRCYEAEKAVVEAFKNANWTAIKLLADMCYQDSINVRKAFALAVETDRWDVVKCLYRECNLETISWAMTQAAERGQWEIVRILRTRYPATLAAIAPEPHSTERKHEPLQLDLQLKEPIVRCIVPGNQTFEISAASIGTVNDLKKVIREKRPDCFGDVSANSIWVYLAKRGGEWLPADSEAVSLLELADSSLVRDLLVWQVMSTCHIADMFGGASRQNAVHVIALKPMLRCIVPGSRPFGMNIDAITQIIDLKRAIKAELQGDLKNVDASDIQLYLAKENGEWLSQSSDEAKALLVGEGSPKLRPMLAKQLSSMKELGNPFADVLAIHLIVISPNRVLNALRGSANTRRFHMDNLRMELLKLQ